jgi:hypothetical protein
MKLLTPKQVAEKAAYKNQISVLRAFRKGQLRGLKLNPRVVRFTEEDVATWLANARV